jgi:hypothetical protein
MTDDQPPHEPTPDDYEEVVDPAPPYEEVDGVPVPLEIRPVEPRRPALLPVPVQAAAVAVGGFLAGVLTIVLFRRRSRRPARPMRRGAARRGVRRRVDERSGVVASRSFLVDVHLLGGRE